jgi:hypothetical protein
VSVRNLHSVKYKSTGSVGCCFQKVTDVFVSEQCTKKGKPCLVYEQRCRSGCGRRMCLRTIWARAVSQGSQCGEKAVGKRNRTQVV